MAKPTIAELQARFGPHELDGECLDHVSVVNGLVLDLAVSLCEVVPEGRQLSLALTALEEVRMRSNAGIAEPLPLARA